ncbi:T9SS type A sorting domain-containing protein [Hymenobacter sp. BRD67]|uniref:T9SS type A sorting domain-containing protein n=1 Tax=Hymenobacter sp. BRD67 TaxID=2675877 RepID=UPI001563D3FB|nr:T9SS type A sorting domain-containing protein [Hymenobacter sp. BRD67]QKG51389.1 T9SS type A sorting domain-containing protein [Hymenobacter sp. BRD67]
MIQRFLFVTALALLTEPARVAQAQTFAPVALYATGANSSPSGIAAGDINGDGYPDLVTTYFTSNSIAVLLNQKDGTFAAPVTYVADAAGFATPLGVTLSDFNKDGYSDIVASSEVSGSVSVLLNKKDGTFAAAVTYSTEASSFPQFLTAGDVNGDGYPDIVTANFYTDDIGVLLNKKDGTFASVALYPTGKSTLPTGLALGDVNKDGYPDIVTTLLSGSAAVLLNKKDGTFGPSVAYPAGANSSLVGVAVGDVDKDGYPDIVTADNIGNADVLLNKKDGTFKAGTAYPAGPKSAPYGVVLGDMNGDGYPDIITANEDDGTASVLLNKQNGTFATALVLSTSGRAAAGQQQPYNVAVSDVNKDGKLDIVAANAGDNTVGVLLNRTATLATQPAAAGQPQATVFPNPASAAEGSTLLASNLPAEVRSLEATLLNSLGQVVAHTTLAVAQGQGRAALPTTGLPSGSYLVRIATHTDHAAPTLLPLQRLVVR